MWLGVFVFWHDRRLSEIYSNRRPDDCTFLGGEEMPKVMHRGHLLLRIMPPYGIISSVMFLMWQSKYLYFLVNWSLLYVFSCKLISSITLNSLTAMVFCEGPLFYKLRSTVISCQIFIRLQSLIAHWTRNDFSLPAVSCDFYEAFFIDDVSRGSKLYLFALVNIVRFLPICALCQ